MMKSSTASDDNTEPVTRDKATRRPNLRYFIVSNVRAMLLGAIISIILLLALELLFPRVTRGEDATAQAMETVTEEATYPLAVVTPLTDLAKGGAVMWTVYPEFNKPRAEGCLVQAAEGADSELETPPSVDFEFVYGDAVEFYRETVPVKIARFLDIFRAPGAARDQIGINLYDVDALSAQGYKKLLEETEPMLQPADANEIGDGEGNSPQRILAFVTSANTMPLMKTPGWSEVAGKDRKSEFIGAPVKWNRAVSDLLRYEAGESDLYKNLNECAEYGTSKLIKRAMYDVIASAEGIKREVAPNTKRFRESEVAKMYLGIMSKPNAIESDIMGLDPIQTVSFRSAWDAALTRN